MLFVWSKRLTSPSFAFVDFLDQDQVNLLKALQGTKRVDVTYDGDTDFLVLPKRHYKQKVFARRCAKMTGSYCTKRQ